jgi:hypothetical protein
MHVENKLVDNWLNLNLSLAGLSWLLYYRWPGLKKPVGFNTSYNTDYNMISFFDYDYTWA